MNIVGVESLPVSNASYMCTDPDERYIYTITESGEDSYLTSFHADGPFTPVSRVKCEAPDPCYIVYHKGFLYTADYSGGSVSAYPASEGKIGQLAWRTSFEGSGPYPLKQLSSHVHMLKIHGSTLYATDLGSDRVRVLDILPDGSLAHKEDLILPEGSGPRHLDISSDGRFVYVLTEMGKDLAVFDNCRESRTPVQLLKLGDSSFQMQNGGDIHLHPNGLFLYVSLRDGDDSIISFYIKPQNGTLTLKQVVRVGAHPRNFVILPGRGFLAVFSKNDAKIQFFPLDAKTGAVGSLQKEIIFPPSSNPVFGLFR